MIKKRATFILTAALIIGSAGLFLSSCKNENSTARIIITRSSGTKISGDSLQGSVEQIVALDPSDPKRDPDILTGEFYSATYPSVSYDGKYLLFSGKMKETDPWQIWEKNLDNKKSRQITNGKENCAFPVYLPGGGIVFSESLNADSLKAGFSLFKCDIDGNNLQRITFNPADYVASNVLKDGRLITTSGESFPQKGNHLLMVLRPDGTKAELFYQPVSPSGIKGIARETADGRLVFIENGKDGNGILVSVKYNRPLHTRQILSAGTNGDFGSVYPMSSGKLLVTFRKTSSDRYSLYEFDSQSGTLGNEIFSDNEYNITGAIESGIHERPKKLPSEVDLGVKTGLLLCQDVKILKPEISANNVKPSGIQIVGIDSILGRLDVEPDGSFYLKVLADKPFKIQSLDKDGNVISSCKWITVRPNERRGCIGCHEDPEYVPANAVPLAVKKAPVNIPMHVNKVIEKKVSLE